MLTHLVCHHTLTYQSSLSSLKLVIERSHVLRQWRSPTFFWNRAFDRQWLESYALQLEEKVYANTLVVRNDTGERGRVRGSSSSSSSSNSSSGGAGSRGSGARSDSERATVRYLFRFCADETLLLIRIAVHSSDSAAGTLGHVSCDSYHCSAALAAGRSSSRRAAAQQHALGAAPAELSFSSALGGVGRGAGSGARRHRSASVGSTASSAGSATGGEFLFLFPADLFLCESC